MKIFTGPSNFHDFRESKVAEDVHNKGLVQCNPKFNSHLHFAVLPGSILDEPAEDGHLCAVLSMFLL